MLRRWSELAHPTPAETVAAWEVATSLTLNQYRRNSWWVNVVSIVPVAGLAAWMWELGWPGFGAVTLAGSIPGLYATGNDMNSIMAGAYPGAGITLGPALTFGFIAGRALAAETDHFPR